MLIRSMIAARNGGLSGVQAELDKGADVNAKALGGYTPLRFAARFGRMEIVELLIANGADVNAKDQDGRTPLHFAAGKCHKEIAELLIASGADVNAKDFLGRGRTPLHSAAEGGHREIAELLIDKGAEVNPICIVEREGGPNLGFGNFTRVSVTSLDLAVDKGHPEIVDLLLAHGGRTAEELSLMPRLSYSNGQLVITGKVRDIKYEVLYSSGLTEWKVLDTVTLSSDGFPPIGVPPKVYVDKTAIEHPMRFYQLRLVE